MNEDQKAALLDQIGREEAAGRYAKQLLENPLFQHVFDNLRKEATERIFTTTPSELEVREEAYRMVRLLDIIKAEISSRINQAAVTMHNARRVLGTIDK